ncbi:MAG: efflux RND transporter permease subunit [Candidatus Omnitrophota bacterium]
MILSDISIRRPVFAWMLMLGLMFFGYISFGRLGVGRMPDVDFPVANIRVSWEGAAPEVMETDVVDVVEDAVTGIQGIREINSSVRQGQASVTVEFDIDRNIDVAIQEIQTKLSQAQRQLPRDMDPPTVSKSNPEDQPIMWITVTADGMPLRALMDYVQNYLEDRFTTIKGVGEVFLGGFSDRNLRVWIDAEKLTAYEMTVQDVIGAIERGHSEVPAGRLETSSQEFSVRAMGEALNTEEFGNIIILQRGGRPVYKPIYLKDVTTIEDGLADVRRISRRDGVQTVGIGIRKQRGSNEVDVGRRVLERLAEVQKESPEGIKVELNVNRVRFVEQSMHELTFTLILSAIITSLICWLFLGSISATLNILLAIPTSILGTFIVINFFGFTLNTFTMLALSLAIGIVVDDAIMVLENIVRYREKGHNPTEAASLGARQITFAAMATTFAVIAIFLPVAFMKGIIGKFFYQFGVTLSVAVAISLLEALTFTPMRCAQFLQIKEHQSFVGKAVETGFRRLAELYRKQLAWSLSHRAIVIIVSFSLFLASLGIAKILRKEFIPSQDQSMFFCRLQAPVGSSIEFTDQKFREAEKIITARPEVLRYFTAVGGFGGGEVNSGQIFVTLKDPKDRPVLDPFKRRPTHQDMMDYFRKELKKISDVKVSIQDPSLGGLASSRGYPVDMTLVGRSWNKLTELSEAIETKMKENPLLTDVDTNYEEGATEVRIFPDRQKASERGVSIDEIGQTINALIAGERVAKYTQGGRRYDVRVRLIPSQRTQIEDIENLWLWNNHGELVQLKDVITVSSKKTTTTITRKDRERAIALRANVKQGASQSDAIAAAHKIAKDILPEGYRIEAGGSTQTYRESFESLYLVLWLGIIIAYMVLASQFNSYIDPVTILLALPFSISGAFLGLWIANQSINIYSFIGIVLLMGIVKKNSILIVEFTNQLRAQGRSVTEALLEAGSVRLRPIFMTSFATIAAALAPALSLGPGSEVLRPMAVTVIGGVIVSTALTVFVIPCVYSLFARFEHKKLKATAEELPV